jgi:TatD DNase family protein
MLGVLRLVAFVAFFDAHNHLQDAALRPYRNEIETACARLPVTRMVVNGTTEADWPEVAVLAGRLPFVLPSFGLHPWHLRARSDHWKQRLRETLDRHPGAAVGEFGLDRWMQGYDFEDQTAVFRTHLEIAAEFGRPATIHCLRAWDDLLELLERSTLPPPGFLVHAYGGPAELVPHLVRLGAYFSFSGHFLNPNQERKRAAFRLIPAERLLVETDAPAMPLPAGRAEFNLPAQDANGGAINHPANIRAVYLGLAELRRLSIDELRAQVAANFQRLFGTF